MTRSKKRISQNASVDSVSKSEAKRAKKLNSLQTEYLNQYLSSEFVVLLVGPTGAGKTFLAKNLAIETNLALQIFQINDQIDSKTLYGQFQSTEQPGNFSWIPSKFLLVFKALQKESLILLENIDHGSSDLIAEILRLKSSPRNFLNSNSFILSPKCRIIMTITTDSEGIVKFPWLSDFPHTFKLHSLNDLELCEILSNNYLMSSSSNLANEKVVKLFRRVSDYINSLPITAQRTINTTDFFRACNRLMIRNEDFSNNNMEIFKILTNHWIMHLSKPQHRKKASYLIGEELSLSEAQINFFLDKRIPEITVGEETVVLGSVHFHRPPSKYTQNFALTKESSQLIEQIALSLNLSGSKQNNNPCEPILLVGDTGVGKTTVVQFLASLLNKPLKIINMNQESEYTDLIGGFKPSSFCSLINTLAKKYIDTFTSIYADTKNMKFLHNIRKCLNRKRYHDLLTLIVKSATKLHEKFADDKRWMEILRNAKIYLEQLDSSNRILGANFFTYVHGLLSEASEQGYWLLIDEINLAPFECLDAILQILDSECFHPEFRLFACMNPVGDVDKRSLPPNIRSRFTEFFCSEPQSSDQLAIVIRNYLPSLEQKKTEAILDFYQKAREIFPKRYSLRTLCRALKTAISQGSIPLAFFLSFSSQLNLTERESLKDLIQKSIGKFSLEYAKKDETNKNSQTITIQGIQLKKGFIKPECDDKFIFTPSVKANFTFIARIVATGHFPILLEGETSAGKTSMISYLAKATGNCLYKINNHENTDIQEYIGGYAPNLDGSMEFVEGILLKAVRNGHWVLLDELNLAPGAVLEALNRLLDDNRELYVPELNCTVKAHPQFQLFATQNPAGTYAGRKLLSKAFMNRFLIIHCDTLPSYELAEIVHHRCGIAPSMAEKMVSVFVELKSRRAINKIFSSSDGLVTLRDLFRWGNRVANTDSSTDWHQTLADQGYFVLGSRCRNKMDENEIVKVLEQFIKRGIDKNCLFDTKSKYMPKLAESNGIDIVLTQGMRRMLILCSEAWKVQEPVLLVGETGCGKTTVAHILGTNLSINCHERMDASDFLGHIRPVIINDRPAFEWKDGVIIEAMRTGAPVLIDEISLAPDSVLERLNSVLEPTRSILLTDTGCIHDGVIVAGSEFQVIATMNPGGDHGKKELSKALRNRFTEIWCHSEISQDELIEIVEQRIRAASKRFHHVDQFMINLMEVSTFLVEYFLYFGQSISNKLRYTLSLRDFTVTAEMFAHFLLKNGLSICESLFHAIDSNIFDSIGVLPTRVPFDRLSFLNECKEKFCDLLQKFSFSSASDCSLENITKQFNHQLIFDNNAQILNFGPFSLPFHANSLGNTDKNLNEFSFEAPTTQRNLYRLLRALNSTKPTMLEGSPGAGKSSLITTLAALTGHKLVRINLSEQTDLYDLFGNDVPVISPSDGSTFFQWMDGPVLRAIKEGSWVLLDEMNLASQSVLEGLNSCFDFRKNLYISELNKTFTIDESLGCRFFACQNPHTQGGGRKALPKSFLNRFLSIYVEEMTDEDFVFILNKRCISRNTAFTGEQTLAKIVLVNKMCRERLQNTPLGNRSGGPFEFNLRDLTRWMDAALKFGDLSFGFDLIYLSRLRSQETREMLINEVFNVVFDQTAWYSSIPLVTFSNNSLECYIGRITLNQDESSNCREQDLLPYHQMKVLLLGSQCKLLEKLAACMVSNWIPLVVGPTNSGKRSAIMALAELRQTRLFQMKLSVETDGLDLLGSFEQILPLEEEQKQSEEHGDNIVIHDNPQLSAVKKSNLQFAWVNSKFVNAYENGHWILIEDVNCCSSAVLDCLNSCLESADGSDELFIPFASDSNDSSSNSNGRTVKRHPYFRLFLSMDPKNGPISRAMRNRSVELVHAMPEEITDKNLLQKRDINNQQDWTHNLIDTISILYPHQRKHSFIATKTTEDFGDLLKNVETAFNDSSVSQHNFCQLLRYKALLANGWNESDTRKFAEEARKFGHELTPFYFSLAKLIEVTKMRRELPAEFIYRPEISHRITIEKFCQSLHQYYRRCWNNVIQNSTHSDSIIAFILSLTFQLCPPCGNAFGDEIQILDSTTKATVICEIKKSAFNANKNFIECVFQNRVILQNCFPELTAINEQWIQLSLNSTNESTEGRFYTDQIQKFSFCRPYFSIKEANSAFIHSNCSSSPKNPTEDIFSELEDGLNSILSFFDNILSDRNSDTIRLPWRSDQQRQIFTIPFILAQPFFGLNSSRDDKNINADSLLRTPFLTKIFCQFWKSIGYDTGLRSVPVGHLTNVQKTLELSHFYAWNLIHVQRTATQKINSMLENSLNFFVDSIEKGDSIKNWSAITLHVVELLHKLVPPSKLVDPLIYTHTKYRYFHGITQAVDVYLNCTRRFLDVVLGCGNYSDDSLKTINREIFGSLCDLKGNSLGTIQRLKNDYQLWFSSDNSQVQCRINTNDQFFQRLYVALKENVAYISNCVLLLVEKLNSIDSIENIETALAVLQQIHTFRQTLQRIQEFLISASDGEAQTMRSPPLLHYPELISPFYALLAITSIAIGRIQKILESELVKKSTLWKKLLTDQCPRFLVTSLKPEQFIDFSIKFSNFPQKSIFDTIYSLQSDISENKTAVNWLVERWREWYGKNCNKGKKGLYYIYKEREEEISESTNDTDERLDSDELELEFYLPDFYHNTEEENESEPTSLLHQQRNDYLTGSELYNGLRRLVKQKETARKTVPRQNFSLIPYQTLMQIFDKFALFNAISENEEGDTLSFANLSELERLKLLLCNGEEIPRTCSSSTSPNVNVYLENSPAQVFRCLQLLTPLRTRIYQLAEEFPENDVLNQVLEKITRFERYSMDVPLMQLSAALERILLQADEWQKLADRAHSIQDCVLPLHDILIDWRRMEVLCWVRILERVDQDTFQLTVLCAWPIFEVALDAAENSGTHRKKVLLMLIDWLNNASGMDFEARLFTGTLLSHLIHSHMGESKFSEELRRCVLHYSQFSEAVKQNTHSARQSVEKELADFVKVIQYNDCNLWSIRQSAQRAHAQLFRILKSYKQKCNEPLAPILLDQLRKPPLSSNIQYETTEKTSSVLPPLNLPQDKQFVSKFKNAASKIRSLLEQLVDIDSFAVLRDAIVEFNVLVKTNVVYQRPPSKKNAEDYEKVVESNEKLQGRALFERQRKFAHIIRICKTMGLNPSRANVVDSELLTLQSITGWEAQNMPKSETINDLVRCSAHYRNVFRRKYACVRVSQQPLIQKQVPMKLLGDLNGITEFVLYWLINAVSVLETRFASYKNRSRDFYTLLTIMNEQKLKNINNSSCGEMFSKNRVLISKLASICERLEKIMHLCPVSRTDFQEFQSLNTHLSELGKLRRDSQEYQTLKESLNKLSTCINSMVEVQNKLEKPAISVEDLSIWHWNDIETYLHEVVQQLSLLEKIIADSNIHRFYPSEMESIRNISKNIITTQISDVQHLLTKKGKTTNFPFEQIMLRIQKIYFSLQALIKDNGECSTKPIDSLKKIIEHLNGIDIDEVFTQILDALKSSELKNADETNQAIIACSTLYTIIEEVLSNLSHSVLYLSSFYIDFEAVSCHLITQGFVNPIPEYKNESEEAAKGDFETNDDINDPAGMGECGDTTGAKDVGDEIENLEQVEGLKGDDQNNKSEDADRRLDDKMLDSDTPLDVEDDFSANLENLDSGEMDEEMMDNEGNDLEDQEDIRENAEWNVGNVEQPEEETLDPKLWDDKEKPRETEKCNDPNAATDKIDELAARELDSISSTIADEKCDEAMNDLPTDECPIDDETNNGDDNEGECEDFPTCLDQQPELVDDVDEIGGDTNESQMPETEDLEINNAEDDKPDEVEENSNPNKLPSENVNKSNEKSFGIDPGTNESTNIEDDHPTENNSRETVQQKSKDSKKGESQNELEAEGGEEENPSLEHQGSGSGENETLEIGTSGMENRRQHETDELMEIDDHITEIEANKNFQFEKHLDDNKQMDVDSSNSNDVCPHLEANKFAIHSSSIEHALRTKKHLETLMRDLQNRDRKKGEEEKKSQENLEKSFGYSRENQMNNRNCNQMDSAEAQISLSDLNYSEQVPSTSTVTLEESLCKQLDNTIHCYDADDVIINGLNPEYRQELEQKWAKITDNISLYSSELAEALRSIIEPTLASGLQGDYRTGKRLNMRRLITYIASDYRKDKIWLRRTKKTKRNYQICIAVDDSSSMRDNNITEITCQSLCLIEQAFRQLEIGQLSICKFGSEVKLLSDFTNEFNPELGIRLLQELSFDQNKTDLCKMLNFQKTHFAQAKTQFRSSNQMLIILGDGRGTLIDGTGHISNALANLHQEQVVVLYLILDTGAKSITEMRVAEFDADGRVSFTPYIQKFPFDFYALVKSTAELPFVVSEAIRQWFMFLS